MINGYSAPRRGHSARRIRASGLARTIACALVACLCGASSALGYVDLAPTLARIISDSRRIALVEVVEFQREERAIMLRESRLLKGEASTGTVRHRVASDAASRVARPILRWAEPGARAVLFQSRNTALVCFGDGWYQVRSGADGEWKLGADRPDLPLAYYGTVSRLADAISKMVSGQDAVLTVLTYGSDDVQTSFDLALHRVDLPGRVRTQRIRANLKMPPMVMAASANPAYIIGPGRVDEADLPQLREGLASSDARVRAESAEELGWLGEKGEPATAELRALLGDTSPRVRTAAAAALLRIRSDHAEALTVLRQELTRSDPVAQRAAARSVGLCGAAAGGLTDQLITLLTSRNEASRVAALEAIATLGPCAARAAGAVSLLLDDPVLELEAASTLGHIGPAARPVPPRIVKLLDSAEPSVQWTAVRAMSQIGGDAAHPAVDFMIAALPKASEVEGYNMMIYLALLGPVARDALPAIRNVRIKNPILPSATIWAIDPENNLPWLRGDRQGPGGPLGTGGDGPDFARYLYEAYVVELGPRLRPMAISLAGRIMSGPAGEMPAWGYRILAMNAEDVTPRLSRHLEDDDIVARERAAVALGYMGSSARAASTLLESAVQRASSERESRLLNWSLRRVRGE